MSERARNQQRDASYTRTGPWAASEESRSSQRSLSDTVPEGHRIAGLTWIRAVPELADLAEPLYATIMAPGFWVPYDDARPVLTELRRRAVPVGVVSDIAWDIAWDIRAMFARPGMDGLIDVFGLSYEYGLGKPDAGLFLPACERLGVEPQATLMVGDTPTSDGGAAALGMGAYILPADGALARRRGLDMVLRMVGE